MFLKIFKRKDFAEEIIEDIEKSKEEYEKLKRKYEKELKEWEALPETKKKKIKSALDIKYRFLKDDLEFFRIRTLHTLLTFSFGFSIINLFYMFYFLKNKTLTDSMVLVEILFSVFFIGMFIYFLIKEKRLDNKRKKYFVLKSEMKKRLGEEV